MDFSGRHYPKDLILHAVRWYLRYNLSYRDLEEILEERGVEIDHTTPYRRVQECAPQLGPQPAKAINIKQNLCNYAKNSLQQFPQKIEK